MSPEEEMSRLEDELERARELEQKYDHEYERTRLPGDAAKADKYGQERMKIQHQLYRLRYPSSTPTYVPAVITTQESKTSAWKTCLGCIFWIAIIVVVAKYCAGS